MPETCRKRKGDATGVFRQLKKLKEEAEVLNVFRDTRPLAGRLQLWNKIPSTHLQSCLNTLDCVAFTDGTTIVCCTAPSFNSQLLGQLVQVNSWTFIPTIHSSDVTHIAAESPCSPEGVPQSAQQFSSVPASSHGTGGSQDSLVTGNGLLAVLGCQRGYLEIHSLYSLTEPSAPTAQVPTFPSLCLSPAAANVPNHILESPLVKNGLSKPRLRLWGSLHCISPPFLLPSKSSSKNALENADGGALLSRGPKKSLFKSQCGSGGQSENQSMLGFLVELQHCSHGENCQPGYNIGSAEVNPSILLSVEEVVGARKEKSVPIYFSGAVAAWRPMLGGMFGECIVISGLRRKMIRVGPERKEFSLFVATRTSLVSHLGPMQVNLNGGGERDLGHRKHCVNNPFIDLRRGDDVSEVTKPKGSSHQAAASSVPCHEVTEGCRQGAGFGSYVGIVTDIFMEGQLLKLDDLVWLLLTHYSLTHVHGLRVGAMVAVRHAHIITLGNVLEKGLLLGACLRSHVWVVLHSGLDTAPLSLQPSQSRLNKCIERLPFASAFWILQLITSLRCKLEGVYTDKELLGTKKHAGIVLKNMKMNLPTSVTLHRDAFKEFLLHERFCPLGGTFMGGLLSKVPPLSNLCDSIGSLWLDPNSVVWQGEDTKANKSRDPESKQNSSYSSEFRTQNVRHAISGEELGIELIGSLEVCQASGKLQLVDATGSIHAIVPDLQSLTNLHCIYQIAQFHLILEGQYTYPAQSVVEERYRIADSPLSWSNLLRGTILEKRPYDMIRYYVQFHLQQACRLEGLIWPSNSQDFQEDQTCDPKNRANEFWKGKEFNIAMITHKYPARLQCFPHKRDDNHWTSNAEAVLLPCTLFIHKDTDGNLDTLNLPWQSVSTHPYEVQGEDPSIRYVGDIEQQRQVCKEELGGCSIDCRVSCLDRQYSGHIEIANRVRCILEASLVMKGSLARCFKSCVKNVYHSAVEEHKIRQAECKLQKVLLSLNWRSVEYSQVLKIGGWYLLPAQRRLSPIDSIEFSSAPERVVVDVNHPLSSLHWKFARDWQPLQEISPPRHNVSSGNRSTPTPENSQRLLFDKEMASTTCEIKIAESVSLKTQTKSATEKLEEVMNAEKPQLVDAVITVSGALEEELKNWLADLRGQLVPPILDVKEILEHPPHPARVLANNCSKLGDLLYTLSNAVKLDTLSSIFSLQGEIVSVQGRIETIEYSSLSREGGQLKQQSSNSSLKSSKDKHVIMLKLQDLQSHQLINVQVNFEKYVSPVGLRPGAVACFHQILLQRGTNIQLRSIPTTLVIVESEEKRFQHESHSSQQLCLPEYTQDILPGSFNRVDLLNEFICQMEPAKDYLRVHCRVVSICVLDLHWQGSSLCQSTSREFTATLSQRDMIEKIVIMTACFNIDDGSAVAECWASGKQAAEILGFPKLTCGVSNACPTMNKVLSESLLPSGRVSTLATSLYQLICLSVQKHKQVTVLGESSQGEIGCTSWSIKGANCNLEGHEGILWRTFLQQACHLGPKVLHCNVMPEKLNFAKYSKEYRQMQASSSASVMSNEHLQEIITWPGKQLVAQKVEPIDTWKELEILASSL